MPDYTGIGYDDIKLEKTAVELMMLPWSHSTCILYRLIYTKNCICMCVFVRSIQNQNSNNILFIGTNRGGHVIAEHTVTFQSYCTT